MERCILLFVSLRNMFAKFCIRLGEIMSEKFTESGNKSASLQRMIIGGYEHMSRNVFFSFTENKNKYKLAFVAYRFFKNLIHLN